MMTNTATTTSKEEMTDSSDHDRSFERTRGSFIACINRSLDHAFEFLSETGYASGGLSDAELVDGRADEIEADPVNHHSNKFLDEINSELRKSGISASITIDKNQFSADKNQFNADKNQFHADENQFHADKNQFNADKNQFNDGAIANADKDNKSSLVIENKFSSKKRSRKNSRNGEFVDLSEGNHHSSKRSDNVDDLSHQPQATYYVSKKSTSLKSEKYANQPNGRVPSPYSPNCSAFHRGSKGVSRSSSKGKTRQRNSLDKNDKKIEKCIDGNASHQASKADVSKLSSKERVRRQNGSVRNSEQTGSYTDGKGAHKASKKDVSSLTPRDKTTKRNGSHKNNQKTDVGSKAGHILSRDDVSRGSCRDQNPKRNGLKQNDSKLEGCDKAVLKKDDSRISSKNKVLQGHYSEKNNEEIEVFVESKAFHKIFKDSVSKFNPKENIDEISGFHQGNGDIEDYIDSRAFNKFSKEVFSRLCTEGEVVDQPERNDTKHIAGDSVKACSDSVGPNSVVPNSVGSGSINPDSICNGEVRKGSLVDERKLKSGQTEKRKFVNELKVNGLDKRNKETRCGSHDEIGYGKIEYKGNESMKVNGDANGPVQGKDIASDPADKDEKFVHNNIKVENENIAQESAKNDSSKNRQIEKRKKAYKSDENKLNSADGKETMPYLTTEREIFKQMFNNAKESEKNKNKPKVRKYVSNPDIRHTPKKTNMAAKEEQKTPPNNKHLNNKGFKKFRESFRRKSNRFLPQKFVVHEEKEKSDSGNSTEFQYHCMQIPRDGNKQVSDHVAKKKGILGHIFHSNKQTKGKNLFRSSETINQMCSQSRDNISARRERPKSIAFFLDKLRHFDGSSASIATDVANDELGRNGSVEDSKFRRSHSLRSIPSGYAVASRMFRRNSQLSSTGSESINIMKSTNNRPISTHDMLSRACSVDSNGSNDDVNLRRVLRNRYSCCSIGDNSFSLKLSNHDEIEIEQDEDSVFASSPRKNDDITDWIRDLRYSSKAEEKVKEYCKKVSMRREEKLASAYDSIEYLNFLQQTRFVDGQIQTYL